MSEFTPAQLAEVATIGMGQSPPSSSYNDAGNGVPFLQGCADFGDKHPFAKVYCNSPTRIAPRDSILISVRAPVGTLNLADREYCIGRGLGFVAGVRADTRYLYYLLSLIRPNLSRRGQGSTFEAINSTDLRSLPVDLPEEPEQRKIARILTTLDNLIEKTESLIAKHQAIKQGMLHDLFTRGVDAHGYLRPSQAEAPGLYQPSELGWIPKEWNVRRLEHLYATPIRDFGSFSSTNLITFLESGVPFIKSEMIEVGNINWEGVTYISGPVHQLLNKSHVRKGDILFSKIGSALGKGVIYDGSRGVCNSNAAVAKINVDPHVAGRHFVTQFLNHDIAKVQLKNMIVSLLPRINLGDLNRLLVPCPTTEEQERIEERFLPADAAIKTEEASLRHLFSVKTGLMQDLLTGKVRVKVDETEEAAHV